MSIRALVWVQVAAAGIGVAIVVAFVIAAGIDYRVSEERGLPPAYTPAWMVSWMHVGLGVFTFASLCLIITGAVLLWRRQTVR